MTDREKAFFILGTAQIDLIKVLTGNPLLSVSTQVLTECTNELIALTVDQLTAKLTSSESK